MMPLQDPFPFLLPFGEKVRLRGFVSFVIGYEEKDRKEVIKKAGIE